MPIGERNVLRSNDSASLWNCTLSPGWTQEEVNILRLALMKFGIGNWSKIVDSQCLVGKTVAQMNLQTQRMLGQQSTAEFANLHIDPLVIGKINSQKQGPDIKRKNNFIVNTGGKLTKEEKLKKIQENKRLYGLSRETINSIVLPTAKPVKESIADMETELKHLRAELAAVRERIKCIKDKKGKDDDIDGLGKIENLDPTETTQSWSLAQDDSDSCSSLNQRSKITLKLNLKQALTDSSEDSEDLKLKMRTAKRAYSSESDETYNPKKSQKSRRK